jgi:L-fuconolactonase
MIVVDAHQHFWNLETGSYPWLANAPAAIRHTFEPAELAPQLAAAGVDRTVLVQAMDSYADTDAMLARADAHDFIAGVVGWVPLHRPAEAAVAIERYGRHPKFVGVRHLIHEEPDPDWLLQDSVQDGLGLLSEAGLSFDVVSLLPRHLEHVSTLAARFPELRLVVDHLSKPRIRSREWEPWASLLARAAEHPNVHAKVSGLPTEADHERWTVEDLRPYADHAIEVFGPERLMYGSDWPVALLAADYAAVWRATGELLAGLSGAERAAVLGGNAVGFYRLAV